MAEFLIGVRPFLFYLLCQLLAPSMRFIFFVSLYSILGLTYAQSLKFYPVAETSCKVGFFSNPEPFKSMKANDSSMVYACESEFKDLVYGTMVVDLKDKITGGDQQAKQDAIILYLEFLKKYFNVKDAEGYATGFRKDTNFEAVGIMDFWKTATKIQIKVKAWTDGNYMGVMYVGGENYIGNDIDNQFFNGFKFPGEY